jgi:mRNA interferase YafQ
MTRTIKYTTKFKRDYKREKKSGHHKVNLDSIIQSIVKLLAADVPLSHKHRDHQLSGEWDDHRDCHIKPDLVLIYRKPDNANLELVRLGSHSELGL